MKKFAMLLMAVVLLLNVCVPAALAESRPVKIVTTIFPIYDWVREIAGTETDMELTMLLDSGVDLHNYQPTAQDILKIAQCDLFIFVGGESDEWTEDVMATAQNKDMVVINLLEALGEDVKEEEIVEGMEHEHHHDEDEDHDEHDHDEDHDEHEHHHEEEEAEYDEHVWLSLRNAEKRVQVIADALCETDADRAAAYRANAESYAEELNALDAAYEAMVSEAAYKTVLFGDRFPFRYMMDDYGLTYFAAFTGCSAETEASFQTILFLAQPARRADHREPQDPDAGNHRIFHPGQEPEDPVHGLHAGRDCPGSAERRNLSFRDGKQSDHPERSAELTVSDVSHGGQGATLPALLSASSNGGMFFYEQNIPYAADFCPPVLPAALRRGGCAGKHPDTH